MKIDILTLFPEMFAPLEHSIVKRARDRQLLDIELINIRDFTLDKHNRVDEYPFGGGVGMLMQAEPIFRAIRSRTYKKPKMIYMSPRGKVLDQEKLTELSKWDELVILCGHYEGVDQRVIDYWDMEEISIGDYVLTGGEPACIVLVDALSRLIPDVLSSKESIKEESIYSGLLEYPQYAKPREFESMKVPEVLISGHHKNIALWQYEQSLKLTKERRKDLFENYCKIEKQLSKEELKIFEKIKRCEVEDEE